MTGYLWECCQCQVARGFLIHVHNRFKEHDNHNRAYTAHAFQRGNQGDQDTADDGVDGEEQRCADEGEQSGTDESTDGEEDESIRQKLRSLGSVEPTGLVDIIDEEGTDGDLCADVHELGDGAEWRSGPPESSVDNFSFISVGKGFGFGLEDSFRNFRQGGEDESGCNGDTHQGNGEVDVLHGGQVVGMFAGEEILRCACQRKEGKQSAIFSPWRQSKDQ